MKRLLAVCMLLALVSCTGSVEDSTMLVSDVSVPQGRIAVVAATNWMDPVGSLAAIDTSANYAVSSRLVTTDGSDVVLRSFFNKIYVINRFGTDTIQVVDPKDFSIVADYSVGGGSNPWDIWVVSDEKAYISRNDSQNDSELKDDVIIVNPLTGEMLGSIDLKSYTEEDGDQLARASRMVAVGNKLFVCLQDLQSDFKANTNGKIAVVNTDSNEVTSVINLSGRDPVDITYSPMTKLIYVSELGMFNPFPITDVTDEFGGIEVIDPETLQSKGIVIDDAALGGYPYTIRIASEYLGFVVAGGMTIVSFNPTAYEIINTNVYTSPGLYLPDFSIDENDNLLIADYNAGVVVLNPDDNSVIAGPIAVGAPPSSITFVGAGE